MIELSTVDFENDSIDIVVEDSAMCFGYYSLVRLHTYSWYDPNTMRPMWF